MALTHWQDIFTKLFPLAVSLATAFMSYRLSKAKSDREDSEDQFKRLTSEIDKVREQRDEYYDKLQKKDQQILKLKKDLLLQQSEEKQREAEHER